jgi:hypothetical protein
VTAAPEGEVVRPPHGGRAIPPFFVLVAGAALLAAVLAVTAQTAAGPPAPALEPSGSLIQHGCSACHGPSDGSPSALAPPLAGVVARAQTRVAAPEYLGHATDVEGYLLESVLDHCADPLPGWDCRDAPRYGNWLSVDEAFALVDEMERGP